MEAKLTRLRQVVDVTEKMLQLAEAAHWDELVACQQERSALLAQVFPFEAEQQTETVRVLISEIIDKNQQLEELCRHARQALQTELHGLNKNRQAVAAYQSP